MAHPDRLAPVGVWHLATGHHGHAHSLHHTVADYGHLLPDADAWVSRLHTHREQIGLELEILDLHCAQTVP